MYESFGRREAPQKVWICECRANHNLLTAVDTVPGYVSSTINVAAAELWKWKKVEDVADDAHGHVATAVTARIAASAAR